MEAIGELLILSRICAAKSLGKIPVAFIRSCFTHCKEVKNSARNQQHVVRTGKSKRRKLQCSAG